MSRNSIQDVMENKGYKNKLGGTFPQQCFLACKVTEELLKDSLDYLSGFLWGGCELSASYQK